MKPHGSTLSFTKQRNAVLLAQFRSIIASVPFIRLRDVGEQIVNSPAPRFWVSEERAAIVISAMLRGQPVLRGMRPSKQEMFSEIFRRVLALRTRHPDWKLSLLVFHVVNSPAPKHYMMASSALERLFKLRNVRHARKNH